MQKKFKKDQKSGQPGIEPGPKDRQTPMLPLHYRPLH